MIITRANMENNLKENLTKLEELQKKQSGLKKFIKDQLLNNPEYNKIQGEIDKLNADKKKIINSVNQDNKEELEKIDELSFEIKKEKQLISDLALMSLVKGDDGKITDRNGMILSPVISVKFKKTGDFKKPENNS